VWGQGVLRLTAVIYTVILFLMNFVRIFDNDFWGDEAFTIRLAKMSVPDMLRATAQDVHPPLFYLFEIAAYRLFGEHGWVFHLVPLVPYAIGLFFIMTVIWKRFGKSAAILMVTFTSLLSTAVTYNVEARMYSWAALFMLIAYYGLYLILVEGKRESYVVFVAASLGAAYSHYYAMMSVAFFYLALLVLVIFKKMELRKMMLTYAATVIGYAPWLVTMVTTFKRTSEGFWMTSVPGIKESIYFFFATSGWYSKLMLLLTFGAVAYVILDRVNIISCKQNGGAILSFPGKSLSATAIWLIWGIVASLGTIALGEFISAVIRPAYIERYLYPVAVVLWLVCSVAVSRLPFKKIITGVVLAATLYACIPQYVNTYKNDKASDDILTSTVEYMRAVISTDDVMLTNGSHLAWTILDYYMPGVSYRQISSGYDEFDPETRYWLVWTGDLSEGDLSWLSSCGYSCEETYHNGILGTNRVHVYFLNRMEAVK
jgi:hypothetical protein